VNDQTDSQLLHAYAEHRSEPAFAELVRRHVDFVHSAALRMVCDAHLAQDVAQGAFVALAKKAGELASHPVLAGWLHRTTQNLAAQAVRTEVRRRIREQEAAAMNESLSDPPDAAWEDIAPQLDAALGTLSEADRDALLLRYFERQSAQQMAQTLGISDEAAQKRVHRAVERLRDYFSRRNVAIGTSGLIVLLTANAVQAAPAGLVATITATAFAGTTISTTALIAATKTIAMTAIQKTLIAATLAVVAGAGIYEARQTAQLREQNHTLQQQQAPLAAQLAKLQGENERLSNQVVQAREAQALSKDQFNELLKLRGKAGVAQADSRELSQLKTTLAQQNGKIPDFMTNAIATGLGTAEKWKLKDAQARLARMKIQLKLTDDQAQAIGDLMQNNIQRQSALSMDMLTGKLTPEDQKAIALGEGNQEADIQTVLTAEQVAAYPDYQHAEKIFAADRAASSEAFQLADNFSLSQEQKAQIQAALYQMNLDETPAKAVAAAAKKGGDLASFSALNLELQKSNLAAKVKILESMLTPEQINTYREEKMNQINLQASALKMFLPPKPAGATN